MKEEPLGDHYLIDHNSVIDSSQLTTEILSNTLYILIKPCFSNMYA